MLQRLQLAPVAGVNAIKVGQTGYVLIDDAGILSMP
jgi:hypothetical protein